MRVISIFLISHILICPSLNAQDGNLKKSGLKNLKRNSVYFEILGNAAVWSVNYDRIMPLKEDMAVFLRVGGNQYHGKDTYKLSFNFLGATGMLYGGPRRFLDTGIGYTYFSGSPDRLITFMGGYRFQGDKGFSFRATPMYIYNSEKGDTFGNSLWFGLSFGYSF